MYYIEEEPLTDGDSQSILRLYDVPHGFQTEADYLGSCVVVYRGNKAEIKGFTSKIEMTPHIMRELKRHLKRRGVDYYEFRRAKKTNRTYRV